MERPAEVDGVVESLVVGGRLALEVLPGSRPAEVDGLEAVDAGAAVVQRYRRLVISRPGLTDAIPLLSRLAAPLVVQLVELALEGVRHLRCIGAGPRPDGQAHTDDGYDQQGQETLGRNRGHGGPSFSCIVERFHLINIITLFSDKVNIRKHLSTHAICSV